MNCIHTLDQNPICYREWARTYDCQCRHVACILSHAYLGFPSECFAITIAYWLYVNISLCSRITDAFNNIRDRVRYLEALSPHLEPLEAVAAPSPAQVTSTILPSLLATMKQMEAVSRVYARSGYLSILCIKVRLVKIVKFKPKNKFSQ